MEIGISKEVVNKKINDLELLLKEAGFEEQTNYIGIIDDKAVVEVTVEMSEADLEEKCLKLPGDIRVWRNLVKSSADTPDGSKAIAISYSKNPTFGIALI